MTEAELVALICAEHGRRYPESRGFFGNEGWCRYRPYDYYRFEDRKSDLTIAVCRFCWADSDAISEATLDRVFWSGSIWHALVGLDGEDHLMFLFNERPDLASKVLPRVEAEGLASYHVAQCALKWWSQVGDK